MASIKTIYKDMFVKKMHMNIIGKTLCSIIVL